MSIQKKSLISTLKTTKKAKVASTPAGDASAKGEKQSSMTKVGGRGQAGVSFKQLKNQNSGISLKQLKKPEAGINFKQLKKH